MSDIVCVTSSRLCGEDFLSRLESIAAARPRAIILREKQLDEGEYSILAARAKEICAKYSTPLILHSYTRVALSLGLNAIHLPMGILMQTPRDTLSSFSTLGASCHSPEDIRAAKGMGCTYVTLGNIFPTQCKPGLEGKGLQFLKECCINAGIPVWAIGGISVRNISSVRMAGAQCACIMGAFMQCKDVGALMNELQGGEDYVR